jgi:CheY-like chemotaxis protein
MDVHVGVVEDSDEDYAALERNARGGPPDIVLERWIRAEALLDELKAGREAWPDLLLIDLSLPGIDGVELVRRLRDDIGTRPLPLFILSGSARSLDIDRCYAAGASLYLAKPLGRPELHAAVELLTAVRRKAKRRG